MTISINTWASSDSTYFNAEILPRNVILNSVFPVKLSWTHVHQHMYICVTEKEAEEYRDYGGSHLKKKEKRKILELFL